MPTRAPNGWITDAAFRAELVALGCTASASQLERWRGEGLLPRPVQVASYLESGRVSGSEVWQPPVAARQVVAIERALRRKKRVAEAGAILWAAGYEVDVRFWRDRLLTSDEWLRRVTRVLRRRLDRDSDDPTIGENVAALDRFTGIVEKMHRRLGREDLARIADIGADIAAGHFTHFDHPASDREEAVEALALRAMDFQGGDQDHIWGRKLNLGADLGPVLAEMSSTQIGARFEDFSASELRAARDDVRNGLKTAYCLYEALAWVYGPQAFGLRMAAYLARAATAPAIFTFTLGFARLRRGSKRLSSSAEIAEMADQAERVWLVSTYFRDLQKQNPKLRDLVGPKRFKAAFRDSREYQKLLKELWGCEFPMPDFRPWDQWNRSSKMMSLGLLAMSIGAPEHVSLADVLRSGDETPNR